MLTKITAWGWKTRGCLEPVLLTVLGGSPVDKIDNVWYVFRIISCLSYVVHIINVNLLTKYGIVLDDSLSGLVYSKEFILVTFKHISKLFCAYSNCFIRFKLALFFVFYLSPSIISTHTICMIWTHWFYKYRFGKVMSKVF